MPKQKIKDSEFAKMVGADKPGRKRDRKFFLFFRHKRDKDIFGNFLYDDECKRFVSIDALNLAEARRIAHLYRGDEYMSVMDSLDEQALWLTLHPRIEQIDLNRVDITANYWTIEEVDGTSVSNKMLRVQATGSKSEVGERIIAALVREFEQFKNKTQLVIHYDQVDKSYIIVYKKTYDIFRVRKLEKAAIGTSTEIIQA